MCDKATPRVLSIQSHVVSGYVGNKSATFPLQLLGFDVDVINSVQFSNHTRYNSFKGQVYNEDDLSALMDGLKENNIDNYSHLLTGFVISDKFLRRIAQIVKTLKENNPNLIYVCDPVMGDNGKMYVPEELKDIFIKEIVPLADIITPNQFELELLLGIKINGISELKSAIEKLHKMGPKIVSISSLLIDKKLISVISRKKENMYIKIEIPIIPAVYVGSGDLFSALLLAHCYFQNDIKLALEKTINTVHEILLKTYEYSLGLTDENIQLVRKIELRLIQSKKIIEQPPRKLQAVLLMDKDDFA